MGAIGHPLGALGGPLEMAVDAVTWRRPRRASTHATAAPALATGASNIPQGVPSLDLRAGVVIAGAETDASAPFAAPMASWAPGPRSAAGEPRIERALGRSRSSDAPPQSSSSPPARARPSHMDTPRKMPAAARLGDISVFSTLRRSAGVVSLERPVRAASSRRSSHGLWATVERVYAALMSKAKKLSLEDLAEKIRDELNVPRQDELFRAAIEAGYLTARADGGVDAMERDVLVKAIELLSNGLVIEWETESFIEDCGKLADDEGLEARAVKIGERLKELGHVEAGLFVAALVARATKGVEKSEAELLKIVAKSAGIGTEKVREIVKRATSLTASDE